MQQNISTIKELYESMHSLVTPEFTGTHEEVIAAVNYWVTTVTHLRSLFGANSSYENKAAIIMQLEKEVGILKAELENVSGKVTTDVDGASSVEQPVPADAQPRADVSNAPQPVDLSVRMAEMAGIKPKKAGPLSRL